MEEKRPDKIDNIPSFDENKNPNVKKEEKK